LAIFPVAEQDFKDMWRRYDQDDNGYLDMDELHILLEDLLERQCGHRNLSDAPWIWIRL